MIDIQIIEGDVTLKQDEVVFNSDLLTRSTHKVKLKINAEEFDPGSVVIKPTCGCTAVSERAGEVELKYTPTVLGTGRKKVVIKATKDGEGHMRSIYLNSNNI